MRPPRIEVLDDADTLARTVAGELLAQLLSVQANGSPAQVALTGGGIAERIHGVLGRLGPDSGVDWSRVDCWWGDERYVPADSPDRNAVDARRSFLDRVPVTPTRVHEVPSADSADTVDAAAAAYARELATHGSGSFDVVMLGLGPDGHVASLFPGHPALDVDDRLAVAVQNSPKPPPERVSLTFDALNRARAIWFVVAGEEKAEAVARALAPDGDLHQTPARGITGVPATADSPATEIVWFLDRRAAAHL
jgi:6-phosphogluconolactonase